MSERMLYLQGADALLVLHTAFVAFVIFGLVAIVIGKLLSWGWIRNPWFRVTHLVCIGIVVLQSWLGVICPLTTWEMALRQKAGDAVYSGSFIAQWLESILYYQAPEWSFILVYALFGSLVAASWFWVRPRRFFSGRGMALSDKSKKQHPNTLARFARCLKR